jgi:hypothetical protein
MEDITPLNLEDCPKLFGLRYDQLIGILISLIVSTQFYSWCNPINFGSHDLRFDIALIIGVIGPLYAFITMNGPLANFESIVNFYFTSQIYIPGPDPNPRRFLVNEELPQFSE